MIVALIQVLRRGRPHELILNGRRRRLWLYFAGNCQYEPQGTAPAYRPNLSNGYLDIRVVDAGPLARSRLVAAVLTGTLGRCRVYHAWRATAVDISSADGAPIWLSVDGEVATAEPGFRQGKRQHGLLVYRSAGSVSRGMPPGAPHWLRRRDAGRNRPRRDGPDEMTRRQTYNQLIRAGAALRRQVPRSSHFDEAVSAFGACYAD